MVDSGRVVVDGKAKAKSKKGFKRDVCVDAELSGVLCISCFPTLDVRGEGFIYSHVHITPSPNQVSSRSNRSPNATR